MTVLGATGLLGSYWATLKPLELEEPLDMVLYRPLAFVIVRAVRNLPVTANQVSIASLIAGVAAGLCFWQGTPQGYLIGAICYFLCNVLDCADGQLARLRNTKSFIGYVLDGTIDALSAIAVFVGIAHGPPAAYAGSPWWIWLVAAGGASMGWSSVLADRKRQEWMAQVYDRRSDSDAEMALWARQATHASSSLTRGVLRTLLAFYRGYRRLRGPAVGSSPHGEEDHSAWRRVHRPILRAAVLTGPTAHISGIILAAAMHRIAYYLVGATAVGVFSAVAIPTAERIVRRRLSPPVLHAA